MRDCAKKEETKFISIIIPIYNAQKTLQRCLDSILHQSFTDFECIMVNDGSKDDSAKIIQEYVSKDERFRMINQSNQGVSTARNTGLDSAMGKYVLFIDSDDYIPESYVAQLVECLKQYNEQRFIWSTVEVTDTNGVLEHKESVSDGAKQPFYRSDVNKLSKYGLLNAPYGKLYNRKIIVDYKILFPKEISIAEDLVFNLSYLDAIGEMPIWITDDVSYNYVRYEGSLDNRFIPGYWEIHKEILQELKRRALEWGMPEQDMQLFYERYWDYVHHALYNTMLEQNGINLQDKLRYNNRILREKEVQECMGRVKKQIRKREYFFYKYMNYSCYYYFKRIFGR